MRIVLILLLVQLLVPAFLQLPQDKITRKNSDALYTKEHRSILLSFLVKEIEEKEEDDDDDEKDDKGKFAQFVSFELIDFSDLTFSIGELHQYKFCLTSVGQRYALKPPLFMLFSTFII